MKQSVSTRSKTQKINNVDQDKAKSTQKKQRKEKAANIKKNSKAVAKRSIKKESPAKVKKSAKKKTARRRLNLNEEEEENDMNQNKDSNESIKILKDSNNATTLEQVKHNLLQPKDLDLEKMSNRKLQKISKISPVIVTPKSTPPKLSLTPHRSKKTPKKSPISLGSPKTHSIAIPKLFKSPRKLSLVVTDEDNSKEDLEKSDSNAKKLQKNKKNNLSNSPMSDKNESIPLTKRNKERNKKSDINLKVIVNINCERKFSKSPKIVLKSPKSKKSRKLKLSPPLGKNVLKTSTSPIMSAGTTPNLNANSPKIRLKTLSKEKNLSIKRRLLNRTLTKTLTTSQMKDVLMEPIVLLEKLPPESLKNMPIVASKTRLNSLMKVKSPSIRRNSKILIPIKKASTDMSTKRNFSPKLRNSSIEKSLSINRTSPRIKYNTSIQGKDILSVPLMSSTPRNEKITLTDTSLTSNTSIASVNNMSLNTRSKRSNQSSMQLSNITNKNTDIKNISEPSLFKEINNTSQSFLLNTTKRDTTYDKNNTMEKKQENKKNNTYELEQPQTINLRQMIKKRASTDANISLRNSSKKAKVRFADVTFDRNIARKSLNKLNGSRSRILNNSQNRSNIMSSAHKSKNETTKLTQNLLISPFKRSTPRIGGTPRVQANKIQVITPKTFTSVEKKSGKTK